jgi:N-acetylglucosaminyl transferase component (Gpi1)
LQALWRVVLGRRKNVLRCRVESYDYYNRQLYIATLLFASLIFLLPTVLVYYVVFASLRFLIYLLTYLLMVVRKKILKFPICTWIRWLRGVYVSLDCMELVIGHQTQNNVTIVYLKPKCLSPWQQSLYEHQSRPDTIASNAKTLITIGEFLKGLVKGEMMGFIQPERKMNKNKNC